MTSNGSGKPSSSTLPSKGILITLHGAGVRLWFLYPTEGTSLVTIYILPDRSTTVEINDYWMSLIVEHDVCWIDIIVYQAKGVVPTLQSFCDPRINNVTIQRCSTLNCIAEREFVLSQAYGG